MLTNGKLTDSEQFYLLLTNSFENAIKYQWASDKSRNDADNKEFVAKSKHILQYLRWLCLELIPLSTESDTGNHSIFDFQASSIRSSSSSSSDTDLGPFLTKLNQNRERKIRFEVMKATPLSTVLSECNKLLRKFELQNRR